MAASICPKSIDFIPLVNISVEFILKIMANPNIATDIEEKLLSPKIT